MKDVWENERYKKQQKVRITEQKNRIEQPCLIYMKMQQSMELPLQSAERTLPTSKGMERAFQPPRGTGRVAQKIDSEENNEGKEDYHPLAL